MARLPRLTVTGYPHHVILRGNNRQDIFKATADYQRMLDLLAEHSKVQGVDIHAYVLMSNHLHLLVTPQLDQALPKMMQAVGRSYVQVFNKVHGRTGTLWEGRYRSTLIQTDRYLLACMAYIDLNPVRAHMVAQPEDYVWSSHAHYIGRRSDRLVTPHALYWALGNTPFAREAAYAELVRAGISADQQGALTDATLSGWALGDDRFKASLQVQTERRLSKTKAGRPFSKGDKPVPN
ncbi:transposase [Limnohabitans sp. JirII-29]|uniref:transposase n=1 Tax=Limnohabitans sp. JirII-29 TaxID=1835756 RepID=UPI000D3A285B|nr:transposase [Limnohabitans sp. JirII-29]PUE24727.1 transposase [Limnohabitans sp. JirII-29]